MRLGQLARKLDIKPTQIVSFLKKEHSITVDESLNSKIEDTILDLVMANFKIPEPLQPVERAVKKSTVEEKIEESNTENIEEKVEDINIDVEKVIESVTEEVAAEIFEEEAIEEAIEVAIDEIVSDELETTKEVVNIIKDTDSLTNEKLIAYDEDGEAIELTVVDGVIKAPKKELEGFKVIGKIDLPQKAKPISFIITKNDESTDITETIEQIRVDLAKRKKEQYLARVEKRKLKSKSNKSNSRRSTLSELDNKEKENKLAKEKQIQFSKEKKAKQKKHYQQNTKIKQNTTKKKKIKTNNGNLENMKVYDKEPTTRWGKIWKWFNT